jgi:hypothetical protein
VSDRKDRSGKFGGRLSEADGVVIEVTQGRGLGAGARKIDDGDVEATICETM